jgi:hypothetical protein
MSRTIAKTLRTVVSDSALTRRCFGYDASNGAGSSRWGDEARNPVVRDSLVPIVVEQTVCRSAVVAMRDKLIYRQEEKGVMTSTPDYYVNE